MKVFRYIRGYEFDLNELKVKPTYIGGIVLCCTLIDNRLLVSTFHFKDMPFNKKNGKHFSDLQLFLGIGIYVNQNNFSNIEVKLLEALEDNNTETVGYLYEDLEKLKVYLKSLLKSKELAEKYKLDCVEIIQSLKLKEQYERHITR